MLAALADFYFYKQICHNLGLTGNLSEGVVCGTYFNRDIEDAVKRFQGRHGLVEDGLIGAATLSSLNTPPSFRIWQLKLNMERWRWLPRQLETRRIQVNIPAYRLQAYASSLRVEKPLDLALHILESVEKDSEWNREKILQLIATGKQKAVRLCPPIPVHLVYFTAWVDSYPDAVSSTRPASSPLFLYFPREPSLHH